MFLEIEGNMVLGDKDNTEKTVTILTAHSETVKGYTATLSPPNISRSKAKAAVKAVKGGGVAQGGAG